MRLKELLLSCDFKRVVPHIVECDPRQGDMITHYKEAYDILCHTEPVASDETIKIEWHKPDFEGEEPYLYVDDCENDLWENNLGKEVVVGNDVDLPVEGVVAYCLWSLTFWGFNSQERADTFAKMVGAKLFKNQYEQDAWELTKRKMDNYHHKEYRKCESVPHEEVLYWMKRQEKRNRSKRMRDHRMRKRIKWLKRMGKIEDLICRLTTDTTITDRKDVEYLFQRESIYMNTYSSRAYDKKQRIAYLIDLLSNYENTDFNEFDNYILMAKASTNHPLSAEETDYFSCEINKILPQQSAILWGTGMDESLGEEVSLLLVGC